MVITSSSLFFICSIKTRMTQKTMQGLNAISNCYLSQTQFMRLLQSYWSPVLLGLVFMVAMAVSMTRGASPKVLSIGYRWPYREGEEWVSPTEYDIPADENGDL